MAKKIRSLDDAPLDIFEAIKRALLRRGFIPKSRQRTVIAESIKLPSKLAHLTAQAHDILFQANTIFPFTLFPSTIIIDREKLTIANRFFFRVAKINSVPIADILSVEADVGPFLGSVHINSRYFITNPYSVNFLSRRDAIKLQHLLQGYIIAHEKKVNCANIDRGQLIALLNDLGQGASD